MGTPLFEVGNAKLFTWPHCAPMKVCTLLGTASPFCVTIWSSASGCQRVGSCIVVPGRLTIRGGFAGVKLGSM